MIKKHPIIAKLLSLNLPTHDYAVFGSGPMFAHGIKDLDHDIDLIARGDAWEMACQIGEPQEVLEGNQGVILFDGEVEIFNGWAPNTWDTDKLIDQADVIEGIRFVSLEQVLKWKEIKGRDKDKLHIEMIKNHLSK